MHCTTLRSCEGFTTKINIKDAFLVIEKQIHCKIPLQEVPLAPLSAFFDFNMHHPPGFTNFHTFLEFFFLNQKAPCKLHLYLVFWPRLKTSELTCIIGFYDYSCCYAFHIIIFTVLLTLHMFVAGKKNFSLIKSNHSLCIASNNTVKK